MPSDTQPTYDVTMLDRLKSIYKQIEKKLDDQQYINELFKDSIVKPDRDYINEVLNKINKPISKAEDSLLVLHFHDAARLMIRTACEFNLLQELHELLELNIEDINQSILTFIRDIFNNDVRTPLGIAAFHGYIELVKYLKEVRSADVNALDCCTKSPLHYAASHKAVAEYLTENYAKDLTCPTMTVTSKSQAKDYKVFCLEHAIAEYVRNNTFSYGYSDLPQLLHSLEFLTEDEWNYFKSVIDSNNSQPYSHYSFISGQLSNVCQKSVLTGLCVGMVNLWFTRKISESIAVGSLSSLSAFTAFTWEAWNAEVKNVSAQEKRADDLLQHLRFFQPLRNERPPENQLGLNPKGALRQMCK